MKRILVATLAGLMTMGALALQAPAPGSAAKTQKPAAVASKAPAKKAQVHKKAKKKAMKKAEHKAMAHKKAAPKKSSSKPHPAPSKPTK